MKKRMLFAFALVLALTACADTEPTDGEEGAEETTPFAYHLEERNEAESAYADDGTLLSSYDYTLPFMVAEGSPDEKQQAVVDAFNEEMTALKESSLSYYGETVSPAAASDYEYGKEIGLAWDVAYDDQLAYTQKSGERFISLNIAENTYTGGAHPTSGVLCKLFDLTAGEWVTAEELTDDPDAFRNAVAESILTSIAEEGLAENYYDDYAETVRRQEGVEYEFGTENASETGVTVYFQDYTLAPHAVGIQSFFVPIEAYRDTLNARGLALFG